MERLELIYKALTKLGFDDLASLPRDKAGEIILQVEDLQNQLEDVIKQKTPD
ncbi:hypothetical protein [Marinomonas fungiae]|uniref:hypothetical protein n=1 Tax=Marinomonas fungiae TaxID=1137284 RepID=UPI003A946FC3